MLLGRWLECQRLLFFIDFKCGIFICQGKNAQAHPGCTSALLPLFTCALEDSAEQSFLGHVALEKHIKCRQRKFEIFFLLWIHNRVWTEGQGICVCWSHSIKSEPWNLRQVADLSGLQLFSLIRDLDSTHFITFWVRHGAGHWAWIPRAGLCPACGELRGMNDLWGPSMLHVPRCLHALMLCRAVHQPRPPQRATTLIRK